MFDKVIAHYGSLDILHNNTGIVSGEPDWPASSLERVRAVIGVNVLGVLLGTRLAVEAMGQRGGGVIINMSSLAATSPIPIRSTPPARLRSRPSPSPVVLWQALTVHVNALVPGGVDTPIINKTGDGTRPAPWLAARSHGPRLTPEDVAQAVLSIVMDDQIAGETVVLKRELGNL